MYKIHPRHIQDHPTPSALTINHSPMPSKTPTLTLPQITLISNCQATHQHQYSQRVPTPTLRCQQALSRPDALLLFKLITFRIKPHTLVSGPRRDLHYTHIRLVRTGHPPLSSVSDMSAIKMTNAPLTLLIELTMTTSTLAPARH
ncbi:hypothetical protein CHS0354_015793, partial [Potamilus streckersoni]